MLSSKQRVGNERNELCASFSTRISRSSHALGHQRERERLFWEQSDHFITRKSGENLSSLKGLKDHSSTRVSTPRVCTRNLESLLRLDSPCQPVRSSNYIRFNYVCAASTIPTPTKNHRLEKDRGSNGGKSRDHALCFRTVTRGARVYVNLCP